MNDSPNNAAERLSPGDGSVGRFRRWLRRILTNRLDQDWSELQAMPDAVLCAEFNRLLKKAPRSDRFRRACQVMGLRFYATHHTPPNDEARAREALPAATGYPPEELR